MEFAHIAAFGREQLEKGSKEEGESEERAHQHGRSPFNIEGLVHGGIAADMRRAITPFGSGMRGQHARASLFSPSLSSHSAHDTTPARHKSMDHSHTMRRLTLLDNQQKNKARVLAKRQFDKTQDILKGPM